MSFPYKKVLLIGATSGIGEALAIRMLQAGVHVVACGRRKANLDSLVATHGQGRATAVTVDISDLSSLAGFAAGVAAAHPDLDCVFVNSGIQRGADFARPDALDLAALDTEMTTNYLAPLHLTAAFLPLLQRAGRPTSLIYTSSGLALVPLLRCPNYCASKAALHHWILSLREQLRQGPGDVRVIEIFPPAVQTELHDQKHQPDIQNGRSFGMPLDAFTDEAWEGLVAGKDEIAVQMAKNWYNTIEPARQEAFRQMTEHVKKMKAGKA